MSARTRTRTKTKIYEAVGTSLWDQGFCSSLKLTAILYATLTPSLNDMINHAQVNSTSHKEVSEERGRTKQVMVSEKVILPQDSSPR